MWDWKDCKEAAKIPNGDEGELLSAVAHLFPFPRRLRRFWKSAAGLPEYSQLLCWVRRFQRLGLYTRCFILLVLTCAFIILCRFIQVSPTTTITTKQQPSWVLHEGCVAEDCHLRDPLPLSQLSPNLLLVLVHASAGRRDRRDALRETWLSGIVNQQGSPIQFRFIIGGEGLSAAQIQDLMEEDMKHKDLLIFPRITDSIYSLTKRTIVSFQYAYSSFEFQYVLKCDDDTYVDVHRIATEVELRKSERPFYWGYMTGSNYPSFIGRYSEFNWRLCDSYMPYALGGGYVLSRAAVEIMALTADHLKMYTCEDVSVGAWLAPYSVEMKHDSRFNTNTPSRGCKDPYLVSHKVSAEQMFVYHESLVLEGKMCSWRTYSFGLKGYVYNWTASRTTACCKRNSLVP